MAKQVDVVNWKKEKVGSVALDPDVFGVEVRKDVLYSVVRWQLASRRQGTHMTKTKGMVSGGGKKPFKQKGTGNARQGSSRSPLMPGGGKVFGPVPRDYSYSLPKKIKKLGLKMALSHLFGEGKLIVVDQIGSDGKTSKLAKNLSSLGVKKSILLDVDANALTARASRNLATFKYLPVEGMNVFDLLKFDGLIITNAAVEKVTARCKE